MCCTAPLASLPASGGLSGTLTTNPIPYPPSRGLIFWPRPVFLSEAGLSTLAKLSTLLVTGIVLSVTDCRAGSFRLQAPAAGYAAPTRRSATRIACGDQGAVRPNCHQGPSQCRWACGRRSSPWPTSRCTALLRVWREQRRSATGPLPHRPPLLVGVAAVYQHTITTPCVCGAARIVVLHSLLASRTVVGLHRSSDMLCWLCAIGFRCCIVLVSAVGSGRLVTTGLACCHCAAPGDGCQGRSQRGNGSHWPRHPGKVAEEGSQERSKDSK